MGRGRNPDDSARKDLNYQGSGVYTLHPEFFDKNWGRKSIREQFLGEDTEAVGGDPTNDADRHSNDR